MGIQVESVRNNQCPPTRIQGGRPPGGDISIPGDKSSQYLTSLMMCAPYFEKDTTIHIEGELTSKPYVDITLDIMQTFGVTVDNESYQRFHIASGGSYTPRTYRVEGDASSATYFFAAAAVTGGSVTVNGLNPKSVQGDIGFPSVLKQMGCDVETSAESITVHGKPLQGITLSMNNMPDAVQTLAVVALFAKGPTTITEIGNLRIKETDRIHALEKELTRLGASVEAGDDFITITPGEYRGASIETYHDHRMAMSFAVAGLRIPGVHIQNPKCVEKSFPDFFDRFAQIYG